MAQRFRILLLVVKKKKISGNKILSCSRFSMPIENYNRRWYSQDKCPDLLNSPYQIMRWIFDSDILVTDCSVRISGIVTICASNICPFNWLSCGLWFQKVTHAIQFIGSTMFLLLCHIVKESPLLRKNGFIDSNFLVL